jgi:group I intron endonuclease
VNGKVYIGSSKNLSQRLKFHRSALRRGNHWNPHLRRAWRVYGRGAFEYFVLEDCEPGRRIEREQYYLDLYQSYDWRFGYNICRVAGCDGVAGRLALADPEVKARHRAAILAAYQNPECAKKISETVRRRWAALSPEEKAAELAACKAARIRHRNWNLLTEGTPVREETRRKLSEANELRREPERVARLTAARLKRYRELTEEERERRREACRHVLDDPDVKARHKAGLEAAHAQPGYWDRHSACCKAALARKKAARTPEEIRAWEEERRERKRAIKRATHARRKARREAARAVARGG